MKFISGRSLMRWRVPLGFALAVIYALRARPTWPSLAAGLFIAALGLLMRALASGHIQKNQALAITGPYRYTRNPLYLGSLGLALGFVLAARDWLMALLALAMLAGVYLPVIRAEEAYLSQRFGADFDQYCRQTPRLFPRPFRRTPPQTQSSGFSWALYLRHREYNALIGYGLLALLLAAKIFFRIGMVS